MRFPLTVYELSYHPEEILKVDLVCLIVIKRIKTKRQFKMACLHMLP